LHRIYPYFFGYICAAFLQTAVLAAIPFRSLAYINAWIVAEAIIDCFYALIVGELYKVVLRDLPGIATVSRRYITVTIGLAVIASLLLLRFEQTPDNLVSGFIVVERALALSVVLFILLMSLFLLYYPIPLNRNVVVYSVGYAAYFLTKAAALFVRTLGHYVSRQISTVLLVISVLCLLLWIFGLSRAGENIKLVIGHRWSRKDEELLLAQLQTINASLLRHRRQ